MHRLFTPNYRHVRTMARGLASKSVLITLPLRCDLIPTFLYSVKRYYRRTMDHYILVLTAKILFELQGYLTISALSSLYAET